ERPSRARPRPDPRDAAGVRPRLRRRLPRRAPLRGHGALRRRRPVPAVAPHRARRRLVGQGRAAAGAARGRRRPVRRGAGRHAGRAAARL
ncbi:MAG: hypothetical protein AVDCRST_MAG30-598, partial [uncultured Solirubrobacteraceae bacterium]